jgi:hypothetical protein
VPILDAVVDAFDPKIEEHQIGEAIDDLGGVSGGIVILQLVRANAHILTDAQLLHTSSHQSMVDVTGPQ